MCRARTRLPGGLLLQGQGLCSSRNARRMAETAVHLFDYVFPPLPVRQSMLSVPKRSRSLMEREPSAVSAVLHIFLRVVEGHLPEASPGASTPARLGLMSFAHRFGSPLNRQTRYHMPTHQQGVRCRKPSRHIPRDNRRFRRAFRWDLIRPSGMSVYGLPPQLQALRSWAGRFDCSRISGL